jgi:hypothetical protein
MIAMRKLDWILFRVPVVALVLLVVLAANRPKGSEGGVWLSILAASKVVAEGIGSAVAWALWILMPLVIVLSPAALAYGIWQHREGGPYVQRKNQNRER